MKKLIEFIGKINIADDLDKDELASIGAEVCENYDYDKESRSEWEENLQDAFTLAKQLKENREYAGERISDVKYPVIASACIQYAARAYPAIVKGDEVVKFKVIGADPQGQKAARAFRVAEHMNTQIMCQMEEWEDGMDQLLVCQPLLGVYYKKTYYDPVRRINRSELVSPEDLVMYFYEKSVEKAERKTHVLEYSHNQYLEMVNAGIWRDIEIEKPEESHDTQNRKRGATHTFYEQHCLIDLDGDDYAEPYIVTVEESTKSVVRIVARFSVNDIIGNEKNEVVRINPIEYFTEFPFMPAFDGSVYRMGFGSLLGPLNHSINTLINLLNDAGKLSNRQSGFLGKNVRLLRGGEAGSMKFAAGEWKQVQCTGDDLRRGVFPLPVREPSNVLFQLLGLLLDASKELASQSELLSGTQNQHNVPATSTLALIEQGLKVFTGVYKRTYRALSKEFKKLRRLNASHLKNAEYFNIVDHPMPEGTDPNGTVQDYQSGDFDIMPVSSTAAITETQKYIKAEAVKSWHGQGLNDKEIARYWFESLEIPEPERFLEVEQGPPPPQFMIEMERLKIEAGKLKVMEFEAQAKSTERMEKAFKAHADAIKAIAEAEAQEVGPQLEMYKLQLGEMSKQVMAMAQIQKEVELAKINRAGMGDAQGIGGGGQAAAQPQGTAQPNPGVPI